MFATTTKDSIAADIKNGASRIGNDVHQTASNVRDDLNQPHLEGAAREIGQKVHDYMDCATHEINDVSSRLTSQIRTSPVQSSIVALAVGFLFGLALRR